MKTKLKRNPYIVYLEKKKYAICTCNKSNKMPFCDGAHKGSELRPEIMVIAKPGRYSICGCNFNKKSSFCNGTHAML